MNALTKIINKAFPYSKQSAAERDLGRARGKPAALALAAEAVLFALGMLFAIKNSLAPGIAVFACLAAAFAVSRNRRGKRKINEDAYEFLSNLIYWYKIKQGRQQMIEASLSSKFFFYNDMKKAMRIYKNCGSAESAFRHVNKEGSFYLRQALNLLAQCIDSGINVYGALNEIKKQFDIEKKYAENMHRETQSSVSMMQIGSSVFFPVFSGVSMDILKFTSQMNGIKFSFWSFSALFMAYIAAIAFINFRYKDGSAFSKAEGIMVLTLFSIILFKASSSAISHSFIM